MSRSLRSTEGGPRIPPKIRHGEFTGLKLADVGSFVRSWALLGRVFWLLWRFVAALGRFWCILARSGFDFGGFRVAPGRILELQSLTFRSFWMHARLRGQNFLNVTKYNFNGSEHTTQAKQYAGVPYPLRVLDDGY